jgi:aspartate-semialdehyde dehydrogenase
VRLAVVGATGLVGEALLDLLPAAALPLEKIHALASAASVGRRVAHGDRHLNVADLEAFDFGNASHVVFAVPRAVAATHVPRATAAGCAVIDASTAWSADVAGPLFAAGTPGGSYSGLTDAAVVSLPAPHAVVVAEALAALQAFGRMRFVSLVGMRAASDRGRAGIAALARETADLLNARPRQGSPFAQQLAFNLIPGAGPADAGGTLADETVVARQLARLIDAPGLPIDVTLIEAPVFYGAACVLRVGFADAVSVEQARAALAATPGVTLADPDEEGLYATPVAHSAGSEGLFVSRLRALPTGNGLVLWTLADNVRHGIAGNALRALAALVSGGA